MMFGRAIPRNRPYWRRFSSSTNNTDLPSSNPITLPTDAEVVIGGGGIIGMSVAYHLAKAGWQDVHVLEQGTISCGTTWHAAGLIGKMRPTIVETRLSDYGSKLYQTLEDETGYGTGWKQCGSVTVARNEDRLTMLKRNMSKAKAFGIQAEIVSPEKAGDLWPHMKIDDLAGALWLPEDGVATSSDLCQALASAAKSLGVKIHEKVQLQHVLETNGEVSGVRTRDGDIATNTFVNCAGQWARDLGRRNGVSVPLHSAEHFYIVTKAIEGVDGMLPILRDPDGYTYFREWSGGILMGGFEPDSKPCFPNGIIPDKFEFELLPDDWDHFAVLMDQALLRCPALETAEIRQMVNGPESFTADNQYILGEAPEMRRYFVAAGFNSSGIASAAGAGRALSEWITKGEPTMDLWPVDIRRFGRFHNNSKFLHDRTLETLGEHYAISWPRKEFQTGRPLRRSPLYSHLREKGAVFGSKMGWERPNYYDPTGERKMTYDFRSPKWLKNVKNEHENTRENVSLFDQTSFSKFLVQGRDATKALQRLCANNVDVPIGNLIYTGMLNDRGGFEADVTVTRMKEDKYFVVSPTAQTTRDMDWMERGVQSDESVIVTDVSSAWCVLGVMGPKARTFLERVTTSDLSNESFPFGTQQSIDIGYATVLASRVTYVGELGWELYIPTEMAVSVYETLQAANEDNVAQDGGYFSIDSLRLEKGYRAWGHELTPDVTPLEAGLSFAVSMDTDFVGKAAIIAQKEEGVRRRLASVTIEDDASTLLLGDEPLFRNGELVGFLSSGFYGFTLGRAVGMGYIANSSGVADAQYVKSGEYEVEVFGERKPAKVHLRSPLDPKGEKIKC